jgi:hypothetical protein
MVLRVQKEYDNLSIIGEWDDVCGYQFIVDLSPNGIDCKVLTLAGCDYGGGVGNVFYTKHSEVKEILDKYPFRRDASFLFSEIRELGNRVLNE